MIWHERGNVFPKRVISHGRTTTQQAETGHSRMQFLQTKCSVVSTVLNTIPLVLDGLTGLHVHYSELKMLDRWCQKVGITSQDAKKN